MEIDGRMVDGYDGYTGAQYANTAYRAPRGWRNNARIRDGGTVSVLRGSTIRPGDEILFAYHAGYWARWAVTDAGCAAGAESTTAAERGSSTASLCDTVRSSVVLPTTTVVATERDVHATNRGKQVVRKRKQTMSENTESTPDQRKKNKSMKCVHSQSLKWTAIARQQYINAQFGHVEDQYGRGEGGGVT